MVTAGNPPEYNRTAHDFDIATWDRLKRIDVEPDFAAWRDFAVETGVHPAVLTYLDIERDHFYRVETTVDGKSFVTARGWDDLSEMMRLCEENGLAVNEKLIGQYLQEPKIAKDFAIYYDLFNKYRGDYQVGAILAGAADEAVRTVLAEQDLGAAELAVVVVAHGGAVGTGVVDVDQVTDVDPGSIRSMANLSLFSHRPPTTSYLWSQGAFSLPSTVMWW